MASIKRESAAKLPARGRGRGRRGGRGGVLDFDSSEEEELGSARTPTPRASSGSDEESDVWSEDDVEDDGSFPPISDSDD